MAGLAFFMHRCRQKIMPDGRLMPSSNRVDWRFWKRRGNLMADWSIWILLGGALIVAELFTGTFYLLMLALGMIAGGIAAYAGLALEWQLTLAALVGIAATVALRRSRFGKLRKEAAERDPNISMDIGQLIAIDAWQRIGDNAYAARVPYRGALWDVDLESGSSPLPGQFRIQEIRGSRLIVGNADSGATHNTTP
jgi:membrane protein implicated in regulation of membrane protease activity